jgi:hypothetical protein
MERKINQLEKQLNSFNKSCHSNSLPTEKTALNKCSREEMQDVQNKIIKAANTSAKEFNDLITYNKKIVLGEPVKRFLKNIAGKSQFHTACFIGYILTVSPTAIKNNNDYLPQCYRSFLQELYQKLNDYKQANSVQQIIDNSSLLSLIDYLESNNAIIQFLFNYSERYLNNLQFSDLYEIYKAFTTKRRDTESILVNRQKYIEDLSNQIKSCDYNQLITVINMYYSSNCHNNKSNEKSNERIDNINNKIGFNFDLVRLQTVLQPVIIALQAKYYNDIKKEVMMMNRLLTPILLCFIQIMQKMNMKIESDLRGDTVKDIDIYDKISSTLFDLDKSMRSKILSSQIHSNEFKTLFKELNLKERLLLNLLFTETKIGYLTQVKQYEEIHDMLTSPFLPEIYSKKFYNLTIESKDNKSLSVDAILQRCFNELAERAE